MVTVNLLVLCQWAHGCTSKNPRLFVVVYHCALHTKEDICMCNK